MSAGVEVVIVQGPLDRGRAVRADGAGAALMFEGIVRPAEQQRPISALFYEAYEPMTTRELRRLAERIKERRRLSAIRVEHSIGRIAVGEVSFRLLVSSPHRAEALDATTEFITEMKQRVPLWKTAEPA